MNDQPQCYECDKDIGFSGQLPAYAYKGGFLCDLDMRMIDHVYKSKVDSMIAESKRFHKETLFTKQPEL